MTIDSLFESKPIQFSGRLAFFIGLAGGALNLLTKMEFLQTTIVIVSGILGIIFVLYKIATIRIQYFKMIHEMKEEGIEVPKFFAWLFKKKK